MLYDSFISLKNKIHKYYTLAIDNKFKLSNKKENINNPLTNSDPIKNNSSIKNIDSNMNRDLINNEENEQKEQIKESILDENNVDFENSSRIKVKTKNEIISKANVKVEQGNQDFYENHKRSYKNNDRSSFVIIDDEIKSHSNNQNNQSNEISEI